MLILGGTAASEDVLPLFRDSVPIKAVLTAPIAQAYAQKDLETRIYFPGKWSFVDAAGEVQRLDVSIRTRGNFRLENCDRPPLQLNFKKQQVVATVFEGQDKLKLVAPCYDLASYRRYVSLEHLAYEILNVLTDLSFRTRLVRLSYVDTDEALKPWTAMTFVIEDEKDLARRLGMTVIKTDAVAFTDLDRPQTALVELFQLLIANNDYSVIRGEEGEDCCHNSLVLAADDNSPKVPVPFDFDFSGLVNAVYAAPPTHLPIEDVRMRYYAGLCHPPGVLDNAIDLVKTRKADILALVGNEPELDERARRGVENYINAFFDILESPKRIERELKDRCRGGALLDRLPVGATDPT